MGPIGRFWQQVTVSVVRRICRFGLFQRLVVRLCARDLRRLNDVLKLTALDDRYWVWSGLLLGWAREGAILQHDCTDTDFGVLDEDYGRIEDAVPALAAAGFRCYRRFANNAGVTTEVTFTRHGIRFEFFRMFPVDGKLRYFTYAKESVYGSVEVESSIAQQAVAPFQFLGRTWLKHEDHEAELAAMYGDWRTPQKDWSYLDGDDQDDRRAWLRVDEAWDGHLQDTGDRPVVKS